MKKIYVIRLIGCDATTEFRAELNDEQYKFLEDFAAFSRKTSTCYCEPKMEIITESDWKKTWEEYDYKDEVAIENFPLFTLSP